MTREGVAIYGATGYTARHIARELDRRGVPLTLVGRHRDRLVQAASVLEGDATVRVAELKDVDGLVTAFSDVVTVINAAGPFSITGQAIAHAAVSAGAHYLNIDGEQASIKYVLKECDGPARRAGVAVVPSVAFYAALPDMLVSLATVGLREIAEVLIVYEIKRWHPKGASMRNRLDGMLAGWTQYEDGLKSYTRMPRARRFDFPPPFGDQRFVLFPAPEVLTIPRHVDTRCVRTYANASMFTDVPWFEPMLPGVTRAATSLMRTPLRPAVERLLMASWKGSETYEDRDDPTTFRAQVRITSEAGVEDSWVSGRGIFDVTGPIMAEAAVRTLESDFDQVGARAPSEAFDADDFLDAMRKHGINYQVSHAREARTRRGPSGDPEPSRTIRS